MKKQSFNKKSSTDSSSINKVHAPASRKTITMVITCFKKT